MSSWLMGLPARIQAVYEEVVLAKAAAQEMPWKVTGLPDAKYTTLGAVTLPSNPGRSSVSLGTATTLQTVLSVTGSGILKFAAVSTATGSTSCTLRIKITADGTELCDTTSAAGADARILAAVGMWQGATASPVCESWDLPYKTSLLIEAQQSANASASFSYTNILATPR